MPAFVRAPRLPRAAATLFDAPAFTDRVQGTRAVWCEARKRMEVRNAVTGDVTAYPGNHAFMAKKIFKRSRALAPGTVQRRGAAHEDPMARGALVAEQLAAWLRGELAPAAAHESTRALIDAFDTARITVCGIEVPLAGVQVWGARARACALTSRRQYHVATPADAVALAPDGTTLDVIEVKVAAGGYIHEPIERWRPLVREIMERHAVPPTPHTRFHVQALVARDIIVHEITGNPAGCVSHVYRADGDTVEVSDPSPELLAAWPEVRTALLGSIVRRGRPLHSKRCLCPLDCGARFAFGGSVVRHMQTAHGLRLPRGTAALISAAAGASRGSSVGRLARHAARRRAAVAARPSGLPPPRAKRRA